jgi:hypothetical protein
LMSEATDFPSMLSSYELFGFMSPALALEIVESTFANNKELYKATLAAVADARKVRPVFLERKPRADRHRDMIDMLCRPRMNVAAATLIRGWLMKNEVALLGDFLNALGIEHKEGAVDDLPAEIEDDKLKAAIQVIIEKHPAEKVAVYLNAFAEMNEVDWPNLKTALDAEPRLQLGG